MTCSSLTMTQQFPSQGLEQVYHSSQQPQATPEPPPPPKHFLVVILSIPQTPDYPPDV